VAMTPQQIFWATISATIVIALANIANSWALAIYNKKKESKALAETTTQEKGTARAVSSFWPLFQLLTGVVNIVVAFSLPDTNPTLTTLNIGVGFSSIVYASVLYFHNTNSGMIGEAFDLIKNIASILTDQAKLHRHSLASHEATRKTLTEFAAIISSLPLPSDKEEALQGILLRLNSDGKREHVDTDGG
jgi:hypothetical protein